MVVFYFFYHSRVSGGSSSIVIFPKEIGKGSRKMARELGEMCGKMGNFGEKNSGGNKALQQLQNILKGGSKTR